MANFTIPKDFPIGKGFRPRAVDPPSPTGAVCEVCPRRDDMDLIVLGEKFDNALLFLVDLAPGLNRLIPVDHTHTVDKIFIIAQRHTGILRKCLRREQRPAPAQLTACYPFVKALEHSSTRTLLQCYPFGITPLNALVFCSAQMLSIAS